MLLIRYICYFLAVALVTFLLTRLEISFPGALRFYVVTDPADVLGTSEFSPIEIIQLLILLVCGTLLGWTARHHSSQRPVAMLFAGLALIFLLRELDYFLDTYVAENFWQVMTAIVASWLIVYCYRHWRRFRIAWFRVWPSPGLTLYFAGAIVVFACATFIGHEPFWQAMLGNDYLRIIKLAVEELTEFIGYTLWLIGTIEYTYQARAIAQHEPQTAVAKRRAGRHPKSEGRF
ncbi:MAG: hypothetical protein OEV63_15930 [Gammaproteobacteria bacterium]|nr:hypothetical protein [Gammaproteobacteria bacterium]